MLNLDQMPEFKAHSFKIMEMIPIWARTYQVDEQAIEKQIPIAYAWTKANPEKAPKKQIVRFLNNWMALAKKFDNLKPSINKPLYKEEKPPEDEVMTGEDFRKMKEAIRENITKA